MEKREQIMLLAHAGALGQALSLLGPQLPPVYGTCLLPVWQVSGYNGGNINILVSYEELY